MWWFLGVLLGSVFLFSIVLSIPVAFDVGGRDSGLAYSLSLFLYYLAYSAIRLVTPDRSRLGCAVSTALRLSQWVVIPSLMIWALGQFAVDAGTTNWVERTLGGLLRSKSTSWTEWVFGKDGLLETVMLGSWDNVLRYSGPVFQLLEGFCTLLVIQAAGQITRWLVNRGRSDTWVVSAAKPPNPLTPKPPNLAQADVPTRRRARSRSSSVPAPSSRAPSTSCGASPSSRRLATSMPRSSASP